MRIIHLNTTYDIGSTGRNVFELVQSLKTLYGEEIEHYICYSQGDKPLGIESFKYGTVVGNKIHAFLARLTGLSGYFSTISTMKLVNYIKRVKPDIIHIGNIHSNNLNVGILFECLIKNGIGVVITLHDCWMYTGKCTHYVTCKCEKWKEQCGACPRLKYDIPSYFFDQTRKMLNDKKKYYSGIKRLGVIGVSKWITAECKQSVLGQAALMECIYNWIDLDLFRPFALDIKKKTFTVLAIASVWGAEKGLEDLLEIAQRIGEEYKIVLVGKFPENVMMANIVTCVGTVDRVDELVTYYNQADVLLNLSQAESFGKVTIEALACGTPVICYDNTATPELVGEGCGYIIENGNVDLVIKKLKEIRKNGKAKYTDNCRKFAVQNFSKEVLVKKHYSFYKKMISTKV